MAVAAYFHWESLGRPWRRSKPSAEFEAKLKAAYPGIVVGSIGNDDHLTSNTPFDHTPFSTTEWPVSVNEFIVFACDVMGGGGAPPFQVLLDYWLTEARAGRFAAAKYLIYQDKIYRTPNFTAQTYSGGYHSHIHVSMRTDHEHDGLAGWSPIPEDEMDTNDVWNIRPQQIQSGLDRPAGQSLQDVWNAVHGRIQNMEATLNQVLALLQGGIPVAAEVDLSAEAVAEIRDAVADLGEGGSAAVRADA